ncbi:MAG: hypothetical protein ACRDRR_19960 [Pseudonocardiaceae bacterium]
MADEADVAESWGCSPRPVPRQARRCWVAECDRCQRPVGDGDERGVPAHHGSEHNVLVVLRRAGWLAVGLSDYCPDCRTAAVESVPVTVVWAGSTRDTHGEVTTCPELVIVSGRSPEGVWLGLRLVHVPTGRYIPTDTAVTVGVLHRMAELLAGLDWSSPDVEHYATDYSRPVLTAYQAAAREHLDAVTQRAAAGGAL